MKPFLLRHAVISPALSLLASLTGKPLNSHPAHVMMLAIALQESDAQYRWQRGHGTQHGPARSWWQFERSGIAGVMRHRASGGYAETLLSELGLAATEDAVYTAMPMSELLAAGFARLLLWTWPHPLPMPTSENAEMAWEQYAETWRPGKPRRDRWDDSWARALDVCGDF